MKTKSILLALLILLLCSTVITLKVERNKENHKDEDKSPKTSVENPKSNDTCSREYCINKFNLWPNPFDPNCGQDVPCWKEWFGFPDCRDDDLRCWKVAVGYPEKCKEDDYDCWLK